MTTLLSQAPRGAPRLQAGATVPLRQIVIRMTTGQKLQTALIRCVLFLWEAEISQDPVCAPITGHIPRAVFRLWQGIKPLECAYLRIITEKGQPTRQK